MDKKQTLNEIMRVYDENEKLKREIEQYKIANAAINGVGDLAVLDPMAGITAMCISLGKKEMWDKVIDNYDLKNHSVVISRENKEFLTFEQWVGTLSYDIMRSSSYYREYQFILDSLKSYSFKDITRFFTEQLREVYDKMVTDTKMQWARDAIGSSGSES